MFAPANTGDRSGLRKACGTTVWVRRGGPNYAEGLAKMKSACEASRVAEFGLGTHERT